MIDMGEYPNGMTITVGRFAHADSADRARNGVVKLPRACLIAIVFLWAQSERVGAQQKPVTLPSEPESSASAEGLPRRTQEMLDALQARVDQSARAAELLKRSRMLYEEGQALSKGGERACAGKKFGEARDLLLSSGDEVFYEPDVHVYFLQIANEIEAADEAGQGRADGGIPIEGRDPRIAKFVKYYEGRGRPVLDSAVSRLALYRSLMAPIFHQAGVPEDLIYVGLVESAYNPYAQSPAGARGIWQFVPGTGKRYGLSQTPFRDEREDPEKSTRAAARYLCDLHRMFGDWLLALAAYNAGEYRILNVIRKTGIRDFWKMADHHLIPGETANYVPAVLAAIRVAGDRKSEPEQAVSTAASVEGIKRRK
ncbi:MAG: lytic transglycosylase domain-containing protein [Blastocatellia bacterium]